CSRPDELREARLARALELAGRNGALSSRRNRRQGGHARGRASNDGSHGRARSRVPRIHWSRLDMSMPFNTQSIDKRSPGSSMAWLALGFRPFYLLAALFAALSVPVWAAQMLGVLPQPQFAPGIDWHTHEMVFGFAVAVITGVLFTAVPNWTGLPTPTGTTLGALALLWVLGRIAMLTGPGWLAALVDSAFLPAIAWCLWQPLNRARSRNRFFVAILLLLAAMNVGFHLA